MADCCEEVEKRIEDLQQQFYMFYSDAINAVYNFDDKSFCELVKSFPGISYVKTNSSDTLAEIDFNEEYIRCAYSLRYAVLSSISIFDHFSDIQPNVFKNLIKKKKIRITCLGGGPATEIIAISKLFNNFLEENEEMSTVKICYTIIDICDGWEKWAKAIVKSLRNCSNLCNTDKIDLRMRFVQRDLSTTLNEDVVKIIEKSQIVTMVKLISTILNQNDNSKKITSKLFSDIALNPKSDTWIFFLDYAGGSYYNIAERNMNKLRYYEQRGKNLHKNQILDIKQAELTEENSFVSRMMKRKYSSKVSSGIWLKTTYDPRMINERKFKQNEKTKKKEDKEKFAKVSGVPVFVKRKGPKGINEYIDFSVG